MEDDYSLLAHLVSKLTSQVEDAATDALAYVLNKSESCREALRSLVSDEEHQLLPLHRASTQVTVPKAGRLDLVGYDADGSMRLIIESKFWAALLSGQASEYVKHLAADKPATLLFVAPEVRRETLWAKIRAQFDAAPDLSLKPDCGVGKLKEAVVTVTPGSDTKWRVALISWHDLLNYLGGVDSSMRSNIRQLRSLANAEDDKTIARLHVDDFNPAIPRRHLDFCRIVDDVVDAHGRRQGWMTTEGLRATPQYDGYLRFFKFCTSDGGPRSSDLALYFSCNQWLKSGTTPLWLRVRRDRDTEIEAIRRAEPEVEHSWSPGDDLWVPLRLLTGVEYADVLEDVVEQVERVRDIVLPAAEAANAVTAVGESRDDPGSAGSESG